jgi:hypothetical protein
VTASAHSAAVDGATTRRSFLALCLAVAGAIALPLRVRLHALEAHAALSFGFTAHERAVLKAAADTVVPGATVVTRNSPPPGRAYPSAGDAGAVDFIENLLSGRMLFAAGARRPPYLTLPPGVVAGSFPNSGALPLWSVKAMGWFGDPVSRPTRPHPWPSELIRLQQLYRQGVAGLDTAAQVTPGVTGFDAAPEPLRETILRSLHAEEAAAYAGQGEGGQPFFLTLLDHVAQACFGDPVYGGNRGYVYWELINFSGPSFINSGGAAPGQGWTWKDLTGPFDRTWKPA